MALFALSLGGLWLAADAAQVAVAAQLAVLGTQQVAVLTIVGLRVYRMLLFPMLFLWLMVPFGESLLPSLLRMTTSLTVTSLNFLGLDSVAEGNLFTSSTGEYAIIEGCASLGFLLGNLVFSLVFAKLMYLGFIRRAVYVLASFPIAISANIVRTTSVVMITEYSGGNINMAIDHGLYGWFIFCIAVLIQMWIGLRYRDSGGQAGRAVRADAISRGVAPGPPRNLAGAVLALGLAIGASPLYAWFNERPVAAALACKLHQ